MVRRSEGADKGAGEKEVGGQLKGSEAGLERGSWGAKLRESKNESSVKIAAMWVK